MNLIQVSQKIVHQKARDLCKFNSKLFFRKSKPKVSNLNKIQSQKSDDYKAKIQKSGIGKPSVPKVPSNLDLEEVNRQALENDSHNYLMKFLSDEE